MPKPENFALSLTPASPSDIYLAKTLMAHQDESVRRLAASFLALSDQIAAGVKQVSDIEEWLRSDA